MYGLFWSKKYKEFELINNFESLFLGNYLIEDKVLCNLLLLIKFENSKNSL